MGVKIATIWNTYGRYHVARVSALACEHPDIELLSLSHCRSNLKEYPFFNLRPPGFKILVDKDESELRFWESFVASFKALRAEKPDLVLACGYERSETIAAVCYAWIWRKTCFLMLDNQYEDRQRNWFVETVKKIYLKCFDGFVYGGDAHRDYLRRLNVPSEKKW